MVWSKRHVRKVWFSRHVKMLWIRRHLRTILNELTQEDRPEVGQARKEARY
jgi:predicted component of type VI protein secretion system